MSNLIVSYILIFVLCLPNMSVYGNGQRTPKQSNNKRSEKVESNQGQRAPVVQKKNLYSESKKSNSGSVKHLSNWQVALSAAGEDSIKSLKYRQKQRAFLSHQLTSIKAFGQVNNQFFDPNNHAQEWGVKRQEYLLEQLQGQKNTNYGFFKESEFTNRSVAKIDNSILMAVGGLALGVGGVIGWFAFSCGGSDEGEEAIGGGEEEPAKPADDQKPADAPALSDEPLVPEAPAKPEAHEATITAEASEAAAEATTEIPEIQTPVEEVVVEKPSYPVIKEEDYIKKEQVIDIRPGRSEGVPIQDLKPQHQPAAYEAAYEQAAEQQIKLNKEGVNGPISKTEPKIVREAAKKGVVVLKPEEDPGMFVNWWRHSSWWSDSTKSNSKKSNGQRKPANKSKPESFNYFRNIKKDHQNFFFQDLYKNKGFMFHRTNANNPTAAETAAPAEVKAKPWYKRIECLLSVVLVVAGVALLVMGIMGMLKKDKDDTKKVAKLSNAEAKNQEDIDDHQDDRTSFLPLEEFLKLRSVSSKMSSKVYKLGSHKFTVSGAWAIKNLAKNIGVSSHELANALMKDDGGKAYDSLTLNSSSELNYLKEKSENDQTFENLQLAYINLGGAKGSKDFVSNLLNSGALPQNSGSKLYEDYQNILEMDQAQIEEVTSSSSPRLAKANVDVVKPIYRVRAISTVNNELNFTPRARSREQSLFERISSKLQRVMIAD